MGELVQSKVELVASIDADDVVRGLGQNDELILAFLLDVLDQAGSSELEERLRDRLKDRSEERAGMS